MEEKTAAAVVTVLIKRDGETKRYRASGQNIIVETTDLLTGETTMVLCGNLNLHEVKDEREVRSAPTREELKRAMRERDDYLRGVQPAPVFTRTDASVPGAWSGDYRSDRTSITLKPLLRPEDLKADPAAYAEAKAWKMKVREELADVLPDPHYTPTKAFRGPKANPATEAFCSAVAGWKGRRADPRYLGFVPPIVLPADIRDLDIRSSHRPKRAVRYAVRNENR